MRIGIDMVDTGRLQRVLERTSTFARRTFSERELMLSESLAAGRRLSFLGGRFAVKEAVLKALGIGISGGVPLTAIETLTLCSGAPELVLSGLALGAATESGVTVFQASISHEGGFAIGMVVML